MYISEELVGFLNEKAVLFVIEFEELGGGEVNIVFAGIRKLGFFQAKCLSHY